MNLDQTYSYSQLNRVHSANLDGSWQHTSNTDPPKVQRWLATLIELTFTIFVIIALVQVKDEATSHYTDKCGTDGDTFFIWMAIRLTYEWIQLILTLTVALCMMGIGKSVAWAITVGVLKFILDLTCVVVGSLFTSKVWSSEDCKTAMSDGSFGHAPLLATFGWIYVAKDAFILLFVSCGGISLFVTMRASAQKTQMFNGSL